MKKIEKRTVICLALTLFLLLGLALFLVRFLLDGGDWASFAANRHLYNSQGQLSVGRVLDRDGDVLSWVDESGQRCYYSNATVRKATLHAVGDPNGAIGTGALVAFADQLSGYNLLTGADNPFGQGNDLYLTLDARLNYIAYQALNGRKGAVGVYNYKTGEDPLYGLRPLLRPLPPPPRSRTGTPGMRASTINRFLSSTFTPGSVFKTVTLTAALEQLPDLFQRTFTCTGSTVVGGETITCPFAHGEMDINDAFASSCNGVFAQLADELARRPSPSTQSRPVCWDRYSVSGISTAAGSVALEGATSAQLGWAGVGQYHDLVNPCALMVWMGGVAQRREGRSPLSGAENRGRLPPARLPHHPPHRPADPGGYRPGAGRHDVPECGADLRRGPLPQYGSLRQIGHC